MGCDIHMYREKLVDGEWKSCDEMVDVYNEGFLDVPHGERFTHRNYNLFGLLSDEVRRSHPFSFKERGLPIDISKEVNAVNENWGSDGHSHSYLYLHELKSMNEFLKTATVNITGQKDSEQLEQLKKSINSKEDTNWTLLYPYCQWSSAETDIDFDINVPASFIIGDGLNEIIGMFKDDDGENHRIVFWFDN